METFENFEGLLYGVNESEFEDIAFRLFEYQVKNNGVYRDFALSVGRSAPGSIHEIPYLPISFFRTHDVRTGNWNEETIFTSSGTTGQITSRHAVLSIRDYHLNAEQIFTRFYGPLNQYHFLALLPSYLERQGSSLVDMAAYFISRSGSPESGFYLNQWEMLAKKLEGLRQSDRKVVLLGVTFALLDLAERISLDLSHCIIMETGGMKGRRKEIVREEVHAILCRKFNVGAIHSEYGMTELLSQGYSAGAGKFFAPPGLRIMIRDVNDPFSLRGQGQTGAINVIDLANTHSCAFIETQDLGRVSADGSFEVIGRMDNSDLRGCNLMVE